MIVGLLVALGSMIVGVRVALRYPALERRYRALTRSEVAFLSSASEAMYPAGGPISSSGLDADIPGYVDEFLVASRPRIRLLLHLLFFLFEHATFFFPAPGWGGFRRFSALNSVQCVAVLDNWASSRWFIRRLVFISLRTVLSFGFFAHPPVMRQLGLAPFAIDTPVCEADLFYPRIGELRESIRLTRDDLTEPSDGTPLALGGPLHPAFTEPKR